MASVTGFGPAHSGQQPPEYQTGHRIPFGVWGDSNNSHFGVGVFGTSGAPAPDQDTIFLSAAAIYGQGGTPNPDAYPDATGTLPGVVGASPDGVGVIGVSDSFMGVGGMTNAQDAIKFGVPSVAVYGDALAAGIGVWGRGPEGVVGSTSGEPPAPGWPGAGVRGVAESGSIGVLGECFQQVGDQSDGTLVGVSGTSDIGTGVQGASDTGTGVQGGSDTGWGVYGFSDTGAGVHGQSTTANGTEGVTFGDGSGVSGVNFSVDGGAGVSGLSFLGSGVDAYSFSSFSQGSDEAAVRGENAHGWAGLFVGYVKVTGGMLVTGALYKGGGGFRVDHPLDPENKYLSHSFVESPEMMNVYSGTVITDDDGNARVQLPHYFEALNRDFRYQLTAIGQFAQLMVSDEINRNEFAIRSDVPRVKVCWQVSGVRQDAWAEAHRIPVEEDKPPAEKGQYLHPELFGDKGASRRSGHRAATVTASLPEHLRTRAQQALSALQATGAAETPDLTKLMSESRDWMAQRASDGRARLREQRQRVQEQRQMGLQIRDRLRPNRSQNRD
jgi:hypothetical protein